MLDPSQAISGLKSLNALFTFEPRLTGVPQRAASDARRLTHRSVSPKPSGPSELKNRLNASAVRLGENSSCTVLIVGPKFTTDPKGSAVVARVAK